MMLQQLRQTNFQCRELRDGLTFVVMCRTSGTLRMERIPPLDTQDRCLLERLMC